MNKILIIIPILTVVFPTLIICQLNGVKPGLISCYNVSAIPGITNANNRPPANLNIFLEILRRLEDANPTVTVRELSSLLVQRLKQNGIIETGSMDLNLGIPYTPYSMEADKGTVVSTYYLTNSSLNLEYGDLDMADVCAFHYMISNTMNVSVRGDESQTCVRSARYQTRMRRKASEYDDFEELSSRQKGLQGNYNVGELSQCPLELGVIYTNYGTIKIGQVLQGLTAGLNQEVVNGVDNRYAATLSSDLDHAAMIQKTLNLNIGVQGGWNSTINPKYFFLQKNQYLELTDQDIKGSVDGLLLALKLDYIKNKFSDIKLSQIIDMYYSPYQKGVFDSSLRACNRNILYSELVSTDYLQSQTITFIKPLDNDGNYPGTFSDKGYSALATSATNNFTSYLPRLSDLACPQVDSAVERVNTDLLIFLDPSWNYNTLQPVLSYILDNIDVNKFGSRYTVFRGSDGVNITNSSTRYLLDFHKQYNLSIHQNLSTNFDYGKVYNVLESIAKSKLNNNSYTGGESTVVLLVPKSLPTEDQKSFWNGKKENAKIYLPDLSILVLGSGTAGDYSSLLFNPSRDFIPLTETFNDNELKNIGQNVIDNIKAVPRAIINPSCGSGFTGSQNSFTFSDNVELHGINYYKIAPHYVYKGEDSKTLKVTEMSSGSITVCLSRVDSKPNNQTGDCQTLRSDVRSIDITNWCGDSHLQECAPIYFSIYGNTTLYKCTDKKCRFPSNIKYSIGMDNAGCSSSAITIVSNFILVALLFLFLRF